MGLISRVSSRTYRNLTLLKKNPPQNGLRQRCQPIRLRRRLRRFLEEIGQNTVPKWSDYAKTACHKQLAPANDDWFYIRTAAVARQLYIKGTLGTGRMATIYGGSANRGFRPSHTRKGNGHIARLAFQQLEAMKLVEKADKGRKLSKDGQRDMDRVAAQINK